MSVWRKYDIILYGKMAAGCRVLTGCTAAFAENAGGTGKSFQFVRIGIVRRRSMEELYVYALLYSEGFDVWPLYADTLDKLFMEDMENEVYLSLEGMTHKEAVLHTISVMHESEVDTEYFGRILMKSLRQIYENMDIKLFAERMYSMWNKLPRNISQWEPFLTLCYADDCLSYNDEGQCRRLYEEAMHFYDE